MKHELKIWPQYYCRVADGSKTFEVRKNDRGFQKGDEVTLYYFRPDFEYDDPTEHQRTHIRDYPSLTFKIGYVLPIDAERVVFSLLPIEEKK